VLVVDDDAMSRDLLAVLLEAEDYAVQAAESGEAALTLLDQGDPPPDLVLADVQLPGLSGGLLADELRLACGPETLLLAISGSQPPGDAISRFDGFLMKPFKMEKIAAALTAHRLDPGATKAPREKWTVVPGPAKSSLNPRLVSIHASAPQPEPDRGAQTRTQTPASAEPVNVPVLNEKIYRQLAGAMPAPQLQEMYAMCLNDARKRIAMMRDLAAAHDGAQFSRQAHAIKGSCGMLGATELYGMAAQLEGRGLEPDASQGSREVNSLDELAAACDRLERMLGSRD
jgi:CheY-like chemotaxis protein